MTSDSAGPQSSDGAHRFMAWLQQGLADGTLRVNVAGSLVHFVDEGMLLVSPRIFREFAKRIDEDGGSPANAAGDAGHRQIDPAPVLRAGWHLRADKGVNILTYQVMRGESRGVTALRRRDSELRRASSTPVPPVNPLLVRSIAKAGKPEPMAYPLEALLRPAYELRAAAVSCLAAAAVLTSPSTFLLTRELSWGLAGALACHAAGEATPG
jgi:hypothetical protein